MRSSVLKLATGFAVALSVLWLAGYANALRPFATDGLRSGNLDFLTYPVIKVYREADETTGIISSRQIDFFNVVDGPTGVEYTEFYIHGWVVSLAAIAILLGGGFYLLFSKEKAGESQN